MESLIGFHGDGNEQRRRSALLLGFTTVGADLATVMLGVDDTVRLSIGMLAAGTLVMLASEDLKCLGFRSRPVQGWKSWIRSSLEIGLAVSLCIAVGLGCLVLTGIGLPIHTTSPDVVERRLLHACLVAPVMEETVYRLVLCVALVPVIGCWRTVFVSGFVFGFLHVLYGNPSPENLVGGAILAWAYLKSESIVIPVLLHSAGNAIIVAAQVAAWYFMHQPS